MAKPRNCGGDCGSVCGSDRLALLLGSSTEYLRCQPGCGWQLLDGDVSRVDVHQFHHQFHESKLGVATSTIDFSLQQIISNQMVSCSSYNYIDMNNFMLHFGSSPHGRFMIRDASYDPRGGALYRITNATLGTLIGSTVPVTSGPRIDGARDNQVVVGRSNLRLIFDLIVVFLDFGPTLGVGEQDGF